MLHHLFMVMSLSGSAVMILYWLTGPLAERYFPHYWRRCILRLSLFFYLCPVSLLKDFVLSRLNRCLPLLSTAYREDRILAIDPSYTINVQESQLYFGVGVMLIALFAFGMVMVASAVVSGQVRQYLVLCRTFSSKAFQVPPPRWLEERFLRAKQETRVRRKVKLICSRLCDAPMAIGIFFPKVVCPVPGKLRLEPEEYDDVLKHELIHVKHHDLLVKFLGLAAITIHWFNPVCYLFFSELGAVSELDCDYGVTLGSDDAGRRRYSKLIIDFAAGSGSRSGEGERFTAGLVNNNVETLERRILEMKKTRRSGKLILCSFVMAVIFTMGTATAFAYEPAHKHTLADFSSESELVFSESDIMAGQCLYDYFFTDEEGNVFPLDDSSSKLFCKHDYIEGHTTNHKRNSNGGCTVIIRSAKMCRYCETVIEGDIISTTTYTVCPH